MTPFSESVRGGGIHVVGVTGDFDLALVEQFLTVARRSALDATALVVDLGDVSFIDSSGLSALLQLRMEVTGRGIPLTLEKVKPPTHRVFELTGLLDVFDLRLEDE